MMKFLKIAFILLLLVIAGFVFYVLRDDPVRKPLAAPSAAPTSPILSSSPTPALSPSPVRSGLPLVHLNGASHANLFAPDASVLTSGTAFSTTGDHYANQGPPKKEVGGIQVWAGGHEANVLMVTKQYVVWVMPGEVKVEDGPVLVEVFRDSQTIATARLPVSKVAPGLLSQQPLKKGWAIGKVLVKGGPPVEIFSQDGHAIPVDTGTVTQPTTLVLLGTGFRHAGDLSTVHAQVQKIPAKVIAIAPDSLGTDKISIVLPPGLKHGERAEIVVSVGSVAANVVTFLVK